MGGFVSAPIIAALTPALGATGAGIAAGGLIGAGAGAGLAALTGGDVGKGALGGALTGGTIGLAPALGVSGIGGTALLGAAGGALGAAATGQDLGRGAIGGAISGGLSGAMRTPTGVEAGSTAGAGASAAATGGVGASASGALPADLTSQFTVGGAGQFPSTSVVDGGAFNPYPSIPSGGVDAVTAAAPSSGFDGFSVGGAATQPLSVSPMAAEGLGIGATGGANIPEGFAAGPAANVTPEFDFTPRGAVGSSLGPQQGQQTTARGGASQFNYNDSTLGQVFDSLGLPQNTITEALAKNPGALIAGGGLAYNLLGQKTDPNLDILKRQAEEMNARGRTLSGYLESGTLPPGAQASINQAKEAAKAKIKSDYAARGMSGSSAELQDLNAVDARAQAQGFSMAAQLLDTGVRQTGLSSEIYANLANLNARRRASTGNAIANFAAALGGGGLTAGRG